MLWNISYKYRDVGLLILRLGIGIGFLWFHGWGKLMGGPERWAGLGGVMEFVGIGFGHTFFGFMAAFSETIGGLLIAAGLFFRPAAILLGFTMFMASLQHIVTGRGSPGHTLKYMFVFISFLFIGPGKYSVDEWISRKREGASA